MGTLWDSFVSGYNDSGPAPANGASPWDNLMSGVTASQASRPSRQSPWVKYGGASPRTHEPGDGFYDQEEPGGGGTVTYQYIVDGLTKRGLPEHVAEAFAMNMQDESGLDAGINEINPIVKGSRGGFGLYQVTGPRRRQYEAFAQELGTDVADPEAQLDFLVWELENTEKRAARSILSAPTTGEAAVAIVNDFLRPAEEHRARRASKYLGGPVRPEPRPSSNKLWLDF